LRALLLLILLLPLGIDSRLHSDRNLGHGQRHCRLRLGMINIGLRLIMINILVLVRGRVPA